MSKFTFLAKRNQHNQIARLLTAKFGKPHLEQYNGPRGYGVMITLDGVSRNAVDRYLFENNVAGAVKRTNLPILKGDKYDVIAAVAYDNHPRVNVYDNFKWVNNGKFQGTYRVSYYDFGCDCCGGYWELLEAK